MLMQLFLSLLALAAILPKTWAGCQLGDDVISLRSWKGNLKSPGQPQGMYPSDQQCQWDIAVSQGSRVKLTFVTFDLEDGYYKNRPPKPKESMLCNDIVEVVDVAKNSTLFKGCQSEGQGRTFESTGNRMSVNFTSDESSEKSGFTATYEGVCQSVISETGFLESPGYPDPPPEGVSCEWNVKSEQRRLLYIQPDENDTSHHLPGCGSSLLNWKTTQTQTGVKPKDEELCSGNSTIVTGSDVILTYQPTSTSRWTGRLLVDYETPITCQVNNNVIPMTSWKGTLGSPMRSKAMTQGDLICQWNIKVSEGSRVKLTFVTFDLDGASLTKAGQSSCNESVKIVYDGKYMFEGCQSEGQGRTFESTGNSMSVYFYSDGSSKKPGFIATYKGICQSTISESGFIESPAYPDPPPEGVSCEWSVLSEQKQILYIRPDDNDTAHVLPDCHSDLLEWKKTKAGPGGKSKELCRGNSKIVTESNVTLTYQPNSTNPWTGRLFLDYNTDSGCDQYCEHGFPCLKFRTIPMEYKCNCEAPYEGYNCEIYVDPCTRHNCSGVGQCSSVYGLANFTCDCPPGYVGADCEQELNPCLNHSCQHGGTCIKERWDKYSCVCLPEYTGTFCSILVGEGYCSAEVDSTEGCGIKWSDTLAGYHDNQPCPHHAQGTAHRNCMKDEESPTGGLWRRPDLSNCVTPVVLHLLSQAHALRETGVEGDVLYNVTRHLDNVTSELTSSDMAALYPGDLLSAADVLADISRGVVNALSVDQDPPGLAQHFTSSIGNILQPETLTVWKNARVHLVENKVTSILTSAQRFAENLVRRQRGASVISNPTSSYVSSALLSSAVDNVDLVVSEWGEENASWTPPYSFASTSPGASPTPRSAITLPTDLLHIARADWSARRVKLYTGRFSSMGPLLSLKESRYTREEEKNGSKLVNSDVLSVEVLDLPPSAFSKLNKPVVLSFPLTDPDKRKDLKKYCVFMNMTTSDPEERWLTNGCYLYDANDTHVTCYCYHLTNFAVLLDVYDHVNKLDKANSAALSYISYIGGSLSILACVVVIVVFEYFRLRSDRVRIHEQLAASIIAVQVLFLIGVGRTAASHSTPKWACKTVAILLHYSLTALFCWMLVEGIHLYVLLVKVFKRGSHLKKYCAIGWGVPFIVVGISVGVFFDKYGDTSLCWLNQELLLVCFVPTVSLVIVINTVILILVLRVMLRSLHSTAKANTEQQGSIKTSLKASAVLLPLLGLTWILGFLAVDTGDQHVTVYVFTYLFTFTNSFQGVMFFVFHCLLNVDVHNAYERRYRQRKRALSSLETQTRKNSEASTYLADSSPTGKSTTKTTISDISVAPQRPSVVAHNRFLLFDRHTGVGVDPTHPGFDPTTHQGYTSTRQGYESTAQPGFQSTPHPSSNPSLPPQFFGRRRSTSFSDSLVPRFNDVAYDDSSLHDVSYDVNGSAFDDVQASDTDRIWRRYSLSQEDGDTHFTTPTTLRRCPTYPSRRPSNDVAAFVTSMHNVLDRPSRNSVRFSED